MPHPFALLVKGNSLVNRNIQRKQAIKVALCFESTESEIHENYEIWVQLLLYKMLNLSTHKKLSILLLQILDSSKRNYYLKLVTSLSILIKSEIGVRVFSINAFIVIIIIIKHNQEKKILPTKMEGTEISSITKLNNHKSILKAVIKGKIGCLTNYSHRKMLNVYGVVY